MVPAVSNGISPVPPYSGSCYSINTLPLRDYHPLWFIFPDNSSSVLIRISQSYNPKTAATVLVWALPLSLAATHRITIVLLSSGYLDVSVHRVRSPSVLPPEMTTLQVAGLPHSEICGSIRVCQSSQLIAAYHVLRRL